MERRYFATAILIISLTVSVCSADEALVGYWAFEEGKGDDVGDLSGLGNNGIIMGKTEWAQGKFGAALAFLKDGQGYVEIEDNLTIGWVDNNRYFDGIIDEVMIWSRALTEEELSGLLSVSPEDKLTTCWGYLRRLN